MNRETRLGAVLGRDAAFDDAFVYGVTSTRVFCRPSCPAKRPKSENIALFESVEAAQLAGFRACLRCQPQRFAAQLQLSLSGADASSDVQLEAATGSPPGDSAQVRRLPRFKAEREARGSVLQAPEAGFGAARALSEGAPRQLGITPASYGQGGAGAVVRFAVRPCALGFLLVAKTDLGVCNVALGDAEPTLEAALRAEFFAARIERDEAPVQSEIELIAASLQGRGSLAGLPLDVRATAFQWRVWRELTRLRRGETVSYGELARRLEAPQAVRAVAAACGQNPLALVHPCHRVVGKNGALTGYRWGLARKRALLESEAAQLKF